MLTRLLPILSLVLAVAVGYYLFSSGMLKEILNPSVTAVVAKRQLPADSSIRKEFIELREVSVRDISSGIVTFDPETTMQQIEAFFAGQVVGTVINKGDFITSDKLGKSKELFVLRTNREVEAGENLTLQNLEAIKLDSKLARGVIAFETQQDALLYVNQAYDLAAKQKLIEGQVLTITDTAGSSEKVYVIRASRDFGRAEQFALNGLESLEVSSRDMIRGAIAFPSRVHADVFISSMDRYFAARRVMANEVLTAEALASDGGLRNLPSNGLPRTLAEMTAYMTAYPGEAMFVGGRVSINGKPVVGETVDVWVETGRTDGMFGEISIERIASDVPVNIVYRNDTDAKRAAELALGLPDDERQEVERLSKDIAAEEVASGIEAGDETADEEEIKTYSWIRVDPEVSASFEKAQRAGRFAFISKRGTVLVDQLGNGATCLEGACRIDRNASEDLEKFAERFKTDEDEVKQAVTSDNILTYLDSVGAELAAALVANGHDSFEKIADWTDEDISAVTIELSIERSHAQYIREQARIMVGSAEQARKALGMEDASAE